MDVLPMPHRTSSSHERMTAVPSTPCSNGPLLVNKTDRVVDIKSRGGRHKDLLGIFFDCFEALRIKEIEAAKRDLERCRQDRIAIMNEGDPVIYSSEGTSTASDHSRNDSCEPRAKRARGHVPSVPSRLERRSSKLSVDGASCSNGSPGSSTALTEQKSDAPDVREELQHPSSSSKESLEEQHPLKDRVVRNMYALVEAYADIREKVESLQNSDGKGADCSSYESALSEFGKVIEEATRYGETEHLASLKYDVSSAAYQSTVSSLEFSSADNSLFSVADISRTIQVFDIKTVLKEPREFHYPLAKMDCNAKISCVAWSPLMSSIMVNSGYDGSVTVWDINKVRSLRKFNEHEKRCWSVSFARNERHICATGSNDCSVKIWNLNMANSVMTIKPYFVVCTVNFGFTKNELAVGSADRSVYLYDLRHPARPLNVFAGHRQAVSYVRYLNSEEIVSASTDNNLRLWNTRSGECSRVFYGHKNTKNFVGLSSSGDHILTGSEDNRAYVYYKMANRPVLCYDVDSTQNIATGIDANSPSFENDSEVFVSAVAWRPDCDEILVGNSVGKVDVLKVC